MPVIWCSISSHGFGHAAQVIPILNALGSVVENVQVILRTCVSDSIFKEYLEVKWELQAVPQDIGCIQRGPLDIDIDETWLAYQTFHENWDQRVDQEVQAMNEVQPNLVLSNISYLAIASAFQTSRPVVALASLSWDQVLEPFLELSRTDQQEIYNHIRLNYAKANHLIRLYPAITMPAFPSISDTGPSFPLARLNHVQDLREHLEIRGEKLVLIAFGGVPLTRLPLEQMEACEGFHFLIAGLSFDSTFTRLHRIEDLSLSFGEIMKQVDVVMTKPGYATITMAVHEAIPLIYVRRHNFIDEQLLVDYVHQYGRALEMSREDFETGSWNITLQAILTLPIPGQPPPKPEHQAAISLLREHLQP